MGRWRRQLCTCGVTARLVGGDGTRRLWRLGDTAVGILMAVWCVLWRRCARECGLVCCGARVVQYVAGPRVAVWCVGAGARARGLVCCRRDSVLYHSCNALMYVVQYFWAGSLKHLFWICWSVTHPWIGSESYLGGDAVLLMTKVTSRVNHPSQDE